MNNNNPPQVAPAIPALQTLAGCIRHLEEEFKKLADVHADFFLAQFRKIAPTFDTWCWEPRDRDAIAKSVGDLPEQPTMQEALADQLLIVWADPKLWYLIRELQKFPPNLPGNIDEYVRSWISQQHHVWITFPASVWLEMLDEPIQRAYLFQLMTAMAPCFFNTSAADPKNILPPDWCYMLAEEELGLLLHQYVQEPGQDWRLSLACEEYPQAVLVRLHAALTKCADDVAYLIKNPGRFDGRRAPAISHRMRTLDDARQLEHMVAMLRQHPGLTDYSLAKQHFGSDQANKRKLASQARDLAFWRDQIPVTFHRSRGDKSGDT